MSEHTKGPWHVGMKPGPIVYGPEGELVADLRADLLPKDEATANMKLILAAPELLAALEAILESYEADPDDLETMDAGIKIARAAIVKAKGA